MMQEFQLYRDIQARTGGEVYIGVVETGANGKIHIYPEIHGADGAAWADGT